MWCAHLRKLGAQDLLANLRPALFAAVTSAFAAARSRWASVRLVRSLSSCRRAALCDRRLVQLGDLIQVFCCCPCPLSRSRSAASASSAALTSAWPAVSRPTPRRRLSGHQFRVLFLQARQVLIDDRRAAPEIARTERLVILSPGTGGFSSPAPASDHTGFHSPLCSSKYSWQS